ncbi:hypothetical protein DKT77_12330 [Meridianimarinicoccus roseus]|uniref:Uncharacterized protein n=1 Tax=Meridianimarinicoccus roseus TaxID=2072018 RepID=A0A2V2LEN4_9RHOB|nr:hypothetical protein [Meridianimarinicoccus roseus]PWR02331.1 hypothetical protein DKT77_12330 [Meridianimarinicoccus roseus]
MKTGEWDVIGAMTLDTATAVIAERLTKDALAFRTESQGLLDETTTTMTGRIEPPRLIDGTGGSVTVEIEIAQGEIESGDQKASLAGIRLSVSGTLVSVMDKKGLAGFGLAEFAPDAGRQQAAVAITKGPDIGADFTARVETGMASWLKANGPALFYPLLPSCPGFADQQDAWHYAGGKAVCQQRASHTGVTLAIGLASRAYPKDDSVLIDADLIAGSADLAVVCSDVVTRYFREALQHVFAMDAGRRSRHVDLGDVHVQYRVRDITVQDERLEVHADCLIDVRAPIVGRQTLIEAVTMRYSVVFDHVAQELKIKKTRHKILDRHVSDTFVFTIMRVIFGVKIVDDTDLFQGTAEVSFPLHHSDGQQHVLGKAFPLDFVPDEGGLRGAMFFRRLSK